MLTAERLQRRMGNCKLLPTSAGGMGVYCLNLEILPGGMQATGVHSEGCVREGKLVGFHRVSGGTCVQLYRERC